MFYVASWFETLPLEAPHHEGIARCPYPEERGTRVSKGEEARKAVSKDAGIGELSKAKEVSQ